MMGALTGWEGLVGSIHIARRFRDTIGALYLTWKLRVEPTFPHDQLNSKKI